MYLKESCIPDFWKVSSMVPAFKNVWKRSMTENYRFVNLLSMVWLDAIPQGSILDPAFFLLQINDLLHDAFCIIATNGDDTTLFSKS